MRKMFVNNTLSSVEKQKIYDNPNIDDIGVNITIR